MSPEGRSKPGRDAGVLGEGNVCAGGEVSHESLSMFYTFSTFHIELTQVLNVGFLQNPRFFNFSSSGFMLFDPTCT